MVAARWIAASLVLALTHADGDFIVPGVREVVQVRPKRQGTRIIMSDASTFPLPSRGLGRFAPRPKPPSVEFRLDPTGPALEDPPDAALELPDDMDLNTMDRNSLSLINSIDNITAFAHLFGLDLPRQNPPSQNSRQVARSGGLTGSAELATMATCKPELQTVQLDLPTRPNTLYYPTCVRLERCGGCCYGPLLTCRPKVTKVVKLQVLKTVVSLSSSSGSARSRVDSRRERRRRRRRRRETVPSYHEVTAIKHVECGCECKVQEQDCNPAIHTYLQSECGCVCKRRDEKKKCEQQRNTKYWDNDSCACYCRRSDECSTGQYFSQDSCRCERLVARDGGFPVDEIEGRLDVRPPSGTSPRRRPVRIPLRPHELPHAPPSSSRSTLLTVIHAPHLQPAL